MASDLHDARGRRFTVATAKKYRTAQKQLDLFKDTKPEQAEPQGEADRGDDDKIVPDPIDA